MASQLQLSGASPQKAVRFVPVYTGRWSSGLWTNRSPLRDANTTRVSEKFYGPAGDALIAGSNVEITNRLTLARRPGNPVFDSNSFTNVDRFHEFRLFGTNSEQINVMVDQTNALYSLFNGTKTLVWTKSATAGQSYMQSVGNTLYFGNGVDNKKWLQSLTVWSSGAKWNTPTTPFLSTFLIDPNGNIQQLTHTIGVISTVQVTSNVATITSTDTFTNVLSVGLNVVFPAGMAASFLSYDGTTNTIFTILSVAAHSFTFAVTHANYGPTAETSKNFTVVEGGTPISGGSTPTWNTQTPNSGNSFTGGTTKDGTVEWTNRGTPDANNAGLNSVMNWGIQPPSATLVASVGSARAAWHANTFYSNPSVVIDSNGNLQRVTTAGTSGSTQPTWATSVGNTTNDGTVVWTMIQTAASLVWAAHHAYNTGDFVIGSGSLFRLSASNHPTINAVVNAKLWDAPHSGAVGSFIQTFPAPGPALTATGQSLKFEATPLDSGATFLWDTINGAGEKTGTTTPFPSRTKDYNIAFTTTINVPFAGTHTFTVTHHDGAIYGFGNGATKVSGGLDNPVGQTQTAVQGYPVMGGTNRGLSGGQVNSETLVVNFPTAGTYGLEIDYAYWYHSGQTLEMTVDGSVFVTGPAISGATQPVWPAWSTAFAPAYPTVSEAAGNFVWENFGPIGDFTWVAKVGFTLQGSTIIDQNGNVEFPYRTGVSGANRPDFATGLNQLTPDNPNLIWINQGAATAPPSGTITALNGGFRYAIALVNTLDNTVSNLGNISVSTGNFNGATGISLSAGSGLDTTKIDPQADFIAVFRTTDGGASPFLIPGTGNSTYTVPLSTYLTSGFTDTVPDEELNNLISAPLGAQNTPPAAGAINLTYHLGRIFFSVGNIAYWTSGPDTPVGNGVNGVSPLNFDGLPSLVKRLVPTNQGMIIPTVSDIFIILGQGTASSPIQKAQLLLEGIGILSYNALDKNGSIIGMYTTDNQFLVLDPSGGVSYLGLPIGDQFRQNNGLPGTAWNASNVYVTWHVSGEDQAWYISDGNFGWYRLMPTPSPETGLTWSPFATIVGGAKAVQSIEVSPGVHKLLLGPTGTGSILNRDLSTFQDNGQSYLSNAVLGSAVLAHPGQIAEVSFVTIDSVKTGLPISVGVLMDEALPYFTGPFEGLTNWTSDPPNLPDSRSIRGQRFYFSELQDQAAVCRHMQIQVNFGKDAVQNEILSMTVFGAILQEV